MNDREPGLVRRVSANGVTRWSTRLALVSILVGVLAVGVAAPADAAVQTTTATTPSIGAYGPPEVWCYHDPAEIVIRPNFDRRVPGGPTELVAWRPVFYNLDTGQYDQSTPWQTYTSNAGARFIPWTTVPWFAAYPVPALYKVGVWYGWWNGSSWNYAFSWASLYDHFAVCDTQTRSQTIYIDHP